MRLPRWIPPDLPRVLAGMRGKVDPKGLAVLSGAAVAAALAGAWVADLLSGLFYVAFLTPAAWGLGLGLATAAGVRGSRWPSRGAALAAGLAVPLLSYGFFHALQNGRLRAEGVRRLGGEREYEQVLRERTGGMGFWSEVSLRAEAGLKLSKSGRRGPEDGTPLLSGSGMYLYWLFELVLIAAVCAPFPWRAAGGPFCRECRRWYVRGGAAPVSESRLQEALDALERRDYAVFTDCLAGEPGPHLVHLEMCPSCRTSPVRLLFESELRDSRGRRRRAVLHDRLISRESLHALRNAGFVLGDSRGRRAGR